MKIEVVDLPEKPALFAKATCSHADIGPTLMRVLPRVATYMGQSGAEMSGPPFCRYTEWRENDCDLEGGCTVVSAVPGDGEILPGTLGGVRAVGAEYFGPYEQLATAHEAVRNYIESNGLTNNGAPFEVYETDPEVEPDPAKWLTMVYWPVV